MRKILKKIYKKNKLLFYILVAIFCVCFLKMRYSEINENKYERLAYKSGTIYTNQTSVALDSIPKYSNLPYVVINNNIPFFKEKDLTTISYEDYGELDELGRCSAVIASIGKDIMPTGEREYIGSVKPTGWQTTKYNWIDGKYLYNRCHLIGYQLTAENANTKNLITGTRYLNVQGMLPFENMIADYIRETNNHVLYRVTPIFEGDNLVASGVLMEAKSVEDNGEGIEFNVYCYNVQPGVIIDYVTGKSSVDKSEKENDEKSEYILNTSSKKFHRITCSGIVSITANNKEKYNGTKAELIKLGYEACGSCNP